MKIELLTRTTETPKKNVALTRCSMEEYELIKKASNIEMRSITSFVKKSAINEAKRVVGVNNND